MAFTLEQLPSPDRHQHSATTDFYTKVLGMEIITFNSRAAL